MDQQTNVFVKLDFRRQRQLQCFTVLPRLSLLVHAVC
jgi:hypothetical protein